MPANSIVAKTSAASSPPSPAPGPGNPHVRFLIGLYEYTRTAAVALLAECDDPATRDSALGAEAHVARKLAEALADHGREVVLGGWRYVPLVGRPADFRREHHGHGRPAVGGAS